MKNLTGLVIAISVFLLSFVTIHAAEKPTVFVSILPQKYFVEQIAGDTINVEVMVQPGASPATYEPKASQMKKLAGSLAYYAVGVPFEKAWLEKIAAINPKMAIIHTDDGIDKLAMEEHHHAAAEHDVHHHEANEEQHAGHDHKHENHSETHHHEETHHQHDGLDPHVWLAPSLVKHQTTLIAQSLIGFLPEQTPFFQENLNIFHKKLDGLDSELRLILKDMAGKEFMVFHPSWGYFANEYGLRQVAIEIEGKDPKPAQLAGLIENAKKHDIVVIFVQPQFSQKSARVIAAEIKGEVISIDPLAEDWFANMHTVAEKFKKALQ